jgi:aspartyl-tRNA synthetase
VSAVFAETPFTPFREALDAGGVVRGLVVPGRGRPGAEELDELVEQARQLGAAGLVWARRNARGRCRARR